MQIPPKSNYDSLGSFTMFLEICMQIHSVVFGICIKSTN